MQNLRFLALTFPEIWRGSQNFKSRSRDPFVTPIDLILLLPRAMILHAKFDISSSKRSRDMEGVQNFICRSSDPFLTCKWGVACDVIFGFLDPDLPIHYITFVALR